MLRRAILGAAVALVVCAPAHAETTVWLGGSTDNNWSTAANWLNGIPPTSGNTADIVFAASPRNSPVHNLGNAFTLRGLFFSDNPYNLSGNALNFDGAFAAIHNSTTLSITNLINLNSNMSYNGTGNATFLNSIDGPGGFIKNGTGTVNLNFFTTYTGPTDINAGQISLGHTQGLLFTTVNLNTDNGINFNGVSAAIGHIAGTGSLNLGAANITVGRNNTSQTYSGQLSGTGSVVKHGFGTWTLTGAGSNFSRFSTSIGPTILSGGSLTLTSTGATDGNRALTVGSPTSGTLDVSGGAVLNTIAAGAGNALIRGASGPSTLTVAGAGSRWDAAQIDIGGIVQNRGVLIVDNGGTINAGDIFVGKPAGGTFVIRNSGIVNANHLNISSDPADPVPTLSLASNGQAFVAETVLATPTSSIDIDRGTLTTAMLTSIGGNGAITLRDPVGGSALTFNGTGTSATYTGSISGSGGITKNGESTQTLSGRNTYSGPTTVNGGNLILANGSSASYNANGSGRLTLDFANFGHSSLRVSGGGTIQYPPIVIGGFVRGSDGNHDVKEVTSFNGTTFAVDSAITVDNALTLNNVSNSGNLTGNKSLTWSGGVNTSAGRFTINSEAVVNSFENNGVIAIQRRGSLRNSDTDLVSGGGGRITIDEGGSLELEKTELHLNGSLLVNNGRIRGTTNVHFGSLLTGTGEFGEVRLHPGGTFTPGLSFGIKPNTSSDLATIVTSGGDHTVDAPITLLSDTLAAVPSDTLRITTPLAAAAGVTVTKTEAGTLELRHVRAAALAVEGGRVVVSPDGSAAGTSELDALTISNGGTLDLTDNDLVLHATAAMRTQRLREVEAYVASARNGDAAAGRWRGAGLTSSTAAANPLTALAVGTSGDDVTARYTYNGDANLDGRINADDYFRIDQGFLAQPNDPLFSQGDFNYDGKVNADDYFLIDQAFLGQGAQFGGIALAAATVPEPGVLAIALTGAAGAGLRRRRRDRREARPMTGLRPSCGYDLRATPERSPACGAVPSTP